MSKILYIYLTFDIFDLISVDKICHTIVTVVVLHVPPNFNVFSHINCMRFGWLSLHYVVDIKCMPLQTIICIHIHICVTQLPTSAAQIEQLGRLISIDIPVSMAGNAKHVLLVIC